MSLKLLESLPAQDNDVAQQVDDGALINFQAAEQRNGFIYGCSLINTTTTVTITPGLLMVRGYRIKIDSNTVIFNTASSGTPSSTVTYYLYLRITHTGNNATFQVVSSTNSSASSLDAIERGEGTYDYKFASFSIGPNGISGSVKNLMGTITPSTAGTASGGLGISLPEPKIELVAKAKGANSGMAGGYLCLGNKSEFSKFTANYSIKFVLYREMNRARYRNKQGSNKVYVNKTGFVKPVDKLGWRKTRRLVLSLNYTELQSVNVVTKGGYTYKRTDVIAPVNDYIDAMFYDGSGATKAAITATTLPRYIRASRCKKNRRTSTDYKHNYFKFAFKAELYDSNNKKVAESGLSRKITIRPNRKVHDLTAEQDGIGELFIISID